MRTGNNPIETYKAAKGGDGLRIREDLPRLIRDGFESLTQADKELLKWVGVFFRRPTPGRFMMRIRMPNGFASSEQLRAVADLSDRLGNGVLDITTRQQIELRGYTIDGVPEIWEKLRGVNLRSLQTGMDNLRNFNGCPLAGLSPKELFDASPIVFELDQVVVGMEGNPEFTNLPRKMNVTVTGCLENCTHTESQDVALVPATKVVDGAVRLGFHVLVGGKMGSGGFTIASNLGWFVEPPQAVEVVLGIIRLFREEGVRGARTKCRLAFLLEEWGLDRFRAELAVRMGWVPSSAGKDARLESHTDHLGVSEQKTPQLYSVGLNVPVGRVAHAQLRELARLADAYGCGEIRLTTGQGAILINVPRNRLSGLLGEPLLMEFSPQPSRFLRGLVSCTGIQYCNLAVVETKSRAVETARKLEKRLGAEGSPLTVYWSGCPAGCGNHLAADIGLRGIKANVGGRVVDAVEIYVGGRTGPRAQAGQHLMSMVPCDEALPDVLATVVRHLELFKQVHPEPGGRDRVLMVPADSFGPAEFPGEEEAPVDRAASCGSAAGRFPACRLSELPKSGGRRVEVGGRALALFLADGRVFAVDADSPHQGGPLEQGVVEDGCVVCPWHDYPFDLAGGRCANDPAFSLRTYPATVEDGTVWVEVAG